MSHGFLECFWISLKLGLISFGGPVAHLGYFHQTYVVERKWLSEQRYGELLALTQFLPGPGSSQLGAAIGYERGGWLGGLGAWLGFTLPSALLMIIFAIGMGSVQEWLGEGWLHGLKLVAVAVIAIALSGMRKGLCPKLPEMLMALVALVVLFLIPQAWMQPLVILLGGLVGVFVFRESSATEASKEPSARGVSAARPWWQSVLPAALVMSLLMCLPAFFPDSSDARGTGSLLHAGALVFGGGHVVLPLLEVSTVSRGLVDKDVFLAGYGAANAVPGPLFTFGGFLGASMNLLGNPWLGGFLGIIAIFLPGMVLLAGGLPVWDRLSHFSWARAGVKGANATVVGVLGAVLLGMIVNGAIAGWLDGVGILVFATVIYFKWLPVWSIVLSAAVIGAVLY